MATMASVLRSYMEQPGYPGETIEAATLTGLATGQFDESVLTPRQRKQVDQERVRQESTGTTATSSVVANSPGNPATAGQEHPARTMLKDRIQGRQDDSSPAVSDADNKGNKPG